MKPSSAAHGLGMPRCPVKGHHPAHIFLGFREGGNPPVARHIALTGVVGRGSQGHVALEVLQQPAQIGQATPDVLLGIQSITNTKAFGSIGDQLHQAEGILWRAGGSVEIRLGSYNRESKPGIDTEARGQLLDHLGTLAEGSTVRLKLLAERLRVFG